MFIGYEQIAVGAAVQTFANLTVPQAAGAAAGATGVVIQANTRNVRYTMDDVTDPTVAIGMLFIAGSQQPTEFLIEDLRRIRFINDGGQGDAVLNLHYFAGRAF